MSNDKKGGLDNVVPISGKGGFQAASEPRQTLIDGCTPMEMLLALGAMSSGSVPDRRARTDLLKSEVAKRLG